VRRTRAIERRRESEEVQKVSLKRERLRLRVFAASAMEDGLSKVRNFPARCHVDEVVQIRLKRQK
jgi:hypothetical protein